MTTWVKEIERCGGKPCPESLAHQHCPEERAELFTTFEGAGTEIETLWLLWSLVRMTKPDLVLETGTFHGIGTVAIASALSANARGKVISLEVNRDNVNAANALLAHLDLSRYAEIIKTDSITYIKNFDAQKHKFDFAFFDSLNRLRPLEFNLLYEKGGLTDLIAFHDTSRLREKTFKVESEPQDKYVADLDRIEKTYCRGGIEFPLAKGLRIMQLDRTINPAFHTNPDQTRPETPPPNTPASQL